MAAAALLSSLRSRGTAEQLAFYVFLVLCLDGLGQILGPAGLAGLAAAGAARGAVAVAEPPAIGLGVAALAGAPRRGRRGRERLRRPGGRRWPRPSARPPWWSPSTRRCAARSGGSAPPWPSWPALHHGIDHLQEGHARARRRRPPARACARSPSRAGARARPSARRSSTAGWRGLVAAARAALDAHAVLCFDFDREREKAYLRAADGPPALVRDSVLDLGSDPFAFVLERGESFYATDFKRLLWSLPYYKGEVKVGTLLAVPVRTAGVVRGALVVDKLEVQALGRRRARRWCRPSPAWSRRPWASSAPRPAARTWARSSRPSTTCRARSPT